MIRNYCALDHNSQILDRLKEVCNPLFLNSCIRSFRYFRVWNNNTYLNVSTNHEWLRDRLIKIPNNGKSFHKPLCSASEGKISFFLWESNPEDDIVKLFKKHNIFNGITAYKRSGESVEAWSFAATTQDSLASNFYINNLHLLTDFIFHFNSKATEIIDVSDTSKLAHFGERVSINVSELGEKHQLFNNVNVTKEEKSVLAPRELECLRWLSIGKTFKETAQIMHISPRTVESYILSIKYKLDLNSKSKIIDYFWKYVAVSEGCAIYHPNIKYNNS